MGSSKGMAAEPAGTSFPQADHMSQAQKLLGMGSLAMMGLPTLRGESLKQYQPNPLYYAAMQQLMQPRQQAPQPMLPQPYAPFEINA